MHVGPVANHRFDSLSPLLPQHSGLILGGSRERWVGYSRTFYVRIIGGKHRGNSWRLSHTKIHHRKVKMFELD